ncbi:hypothetical protein DXG03_001302 [Asterophora parasitica]|uniref:Uncharacterized protein n=1 Tax=Asterophora parasitica TaxID=117018 RepID=A0A9P7K8G0_9AGAR|nr:hypothetical protein DXG03_001302 [Asterophora parasitica]
MSTPSRNKTAVRSQTGNTKSKVDDLTPAVMGDLKEDRIELREFDDLLMHFLYLVTDGDTRAQLDKQLGYIEDLQESIDSYAELTETKASCRATLKGLLDDCLTEVLPHCEDKELEKHLRN